MPIEATSWVPDEARLMAMGRVTICRGPSSSGSATFNAGGTLSNRIILVAAATAAATSYRVYVVLTWTVDYHYMQLKLRPGCNGCPRDCPNPAT